jgi:tRNA pseudouridine55 synthase
VSLTSAAAGILNLNKPTGPTSFKIVRDIRRITGERRVGHGGTLDPIATGVLPILLGQATRLANFVHAWPKTYEATVRFGAISDTYDADGLINPLVAAPLPTRERVEAALPEFKGLIQQKPPIYSAIKVGGEPLYRKARRGEAIQPTARTVEVKDLRLLSMDEKTGRCELEILAGKGLYVRSLAHDMGESLGCGAYLAGLIRTAYGPLRLAEAVTAEQLSDGENWKGFLLPMDLPLREWPAIYLDPDGVRSVLHGRAVHGEEPRNEERVRLVEQRGQTLLGWGVWASDGLIYPRAVFGR